MNHLGAHFTLIIMTQYLKEKKDDGVIAGVSKEIEHMITRGQLDLPITLCFAASRGDEHLLHQLLKRRGLDPNETDNDGRTALVTIDQNTLLVTPGVLICEI